jgi:hypothetical protein
MKGLLRRRDGQGVRFAVGAEGMPADWHGHVTIEHDVEAGLCVAQYTLVLREHTDGKEDVAPASFLSEAIARASNGTVGSAHGLVAGTFEFPLSEWGSVVPLPLEMPGGTSFGSQQAKVAGLDFLFSDSDAETHLVRVFVTTFPETDRLVLRLALRASVNLETFLARQLLHALESLVPLFAKRLA